MAYTQNYGRGNFDKTGNNIPSEFKQNNEPPGKIELTKRFTDTVETLKKNRVSDAKSTQGSNPQGISINANSGEATAKSYEKKYVKGAKGSYDRVVDGAGKIIGQASNPRKGGKGSNEDLYRNFQKDSTLTMNQRNSNAHFHNLTAGLIQNRSEADNQTLVKLGSAVRVK